jgi:iron complex transport system permease protein
MALIACGSGYRALTLGDDVAATMGVNVRRLRIVTIAAVAAGVGGGVAVSGSIGFVGLVAPYLVRPFCGADPGRILAPSAAAGAALLTAADVAVRLIPSNTELKVGVLTSLLGVPLFLWLVLSRRSGFREGA